METQSENVRPTSAGGKQDSTPSSTRQALAPRDPNTSSEPETASQKTPDPTSERTPRSGPDPTFPPLSQEEAEEEEQELGPRASRLRATFGAALSRTLATLNFTAFSGCFPTPAAYRPATLRAFWEQFRNRLGEVCLAEYEAILADRDVFALLNQLDGFIGEAKRRRAEAVVGRGSEGDADTPVV